MLTLIAVLCAFIVSFLLFIVLARISNDGRREVGRAAFILGWIFGAAVAYLFWFLT